MVVAAVALVATTAGLAAPAVAAVGTTAASAGGIAGVSAATLGTIGAYGGLAAGVLSAVAGATAPGMSTQGSATTFQTNPQSGLPYAMGRTRMSGLRMFADTNTRPGYTKFNDLLWFGALLSIGGQIEGIEKFTADNEVVTFDGSGEAIGNFRNYMGQKIHLGGSQASAIALNLEGGTAPGWTAPHRLSGITHAMWCLRYNKQGEMYGAGAPEPAWIGKWVKVYDPRLDSTYPGGSGPCRALDETTYVWSDNPGLHALTWALGRWQNGKRTCGIGAPVANIRVAEFVECANVCEANVWKVGGVEWTTDSKWDTLKRILQAGGARPTQTGAMIGCLVSAPRTAIATIESRHLLDSLSIAATKSRRDRFNTVIPRYVDEDSDWAVISGTAVTEPAYVTADKGQRNKEIDFPLVQVFSGANAAQPGQLAAYAIVDSREAGPFTWTTGPEWIGLKTGDVIYLNVPEEGLINQPVLINRRAIDPATGKVSFSAETETYSKHAYALGQSTTPPAPFQLSAPDLKPAAPVETSWSVSGATSGEGFPALLVVGESELPSADAVVIDYRLSGTEEWTSSAILSAVDPVSHVIAPLESTTAYDVRIGYRVESILGSFTIFANVVTGQGKITIIEDQLGGIDQDLAQLDLDIAAAETAIAAAQSTITQIQADADSVRAGFEQDIAALGAEADQIRTDAAAATAVVQAEVTALQGTAAQIQQDAAATKAALEGDIAGLEQTAAQIQQDATALQATVTQAQSDLAAQGASIQQAQADIIATGGRITTVEQALGDQDASITSLSQTVSNHTGRLATVESTVSTQGASISQNATAISTAQGDIASISQVVVSQGSSISSLAQAVSTASGDIASLSNTVGTQGASITSLQTASSTQAGDIAALTLKVTAGNPNILPYGGFEGGAAGWSANAAFYPGPTSDGWGPYLVSNSVIADGAEIVLYREVPALAGAAYTLTGDLGQIITAGAGSHYFVIEPLNAAGDQAGPPANGPARQSSVSFDFTGASREQLKVSLIAPAGTTKLRVYAVWFKQSGTANNCHVRQMKLERGTIPTPFTQEATVVQSFQALTMLDTQVAQLGTTVGTQGASISQNATAITGVTGRTATLESTVSAQGSSISSLAQAVSTATGDIVTLKTDLSTANANISLNASAVSTANEGLASLGARVGTTESSITQNAQAISTAQGNLASLSGTVSSQGSSITSLQSASSTAAGDIAQLRTDLATANASISQNATAVTAASQNIATLTSKVTAGNPNLTPGFENGTAGWSSNTTFYPGPVTDGWGPYVVTSSAVTNGTSVILYREVPALAGIAYTLTGDLGQIITGGTGVHYFVIEPLDGAGNPIGPAANGPSRGSGVSFDATGASREQLKVSLIAPASTAKLRIYAIWLKQSGTTQNFHARQIKLERGTVATPYSQEATVVQSFQALSTLDTQYASLSNMVSTQGATVAQNATAITGLQGNLASLSSTVSAQGSSITSLQSASSSHAGQIAQFSIDLATANASVGQNATAITSANQNIAGLSSTVSAQGSSITQAQQAISTLQSQAATLTTRVTASNPNLAENGGFENGIAGWTSNGTFGPGPLADGWGAYVSSNTALADGGNRILYREMPASGGAIYTLSADMGQIITGGTGVHYLQIEYLNAAGNQVGFSNGTPRPSGVSFDATGAGREQLKVSLLAPASTATARIYAVWFKQSGTVSNFHIRQVKFERGGVATPFSAEASVVQQFQALSALNTQYASLSNTVGTQGVTITTQQTAITTVQNNVSTLMGQWGVELDVNGYVSGVKLNNNGSRADMTLRMDKVRMVTPSGLGGYWQVTFDGAGRPTQTIGDDAAGVTIELGYLA
ncbi:hypothetical protein V474_07665 [Novosphingobium barchaimii LL02]|uniref:DUF1983 domain-containing protein n=2 Tax=Novosphingobium barchaimii TaxID=1420591 RepID=A0A0J7Y726_9SPHN|nr:hypothetical protein V474_07665 [Novosphingobium barchaimii LL02]